MSKKITHEHVFKIEGGGKEDTVEYIDFACTACDMKMFVKGEFSWHTNWAERILKVKDLEEKK